MLLPDEYFKTYAEKLAEIGEPKRAWDETEKEFNRRYSCTRSDVILRRFASYESFQSAFRRYRSEGVIDHIEIKILLVPEIEAEETDAESV